MRIKLGATVLVVAWTILAAGSTKADFGGQTILGPLGPGSVVNGNTIGATDDNDGITSGMHIFEVWMGPDDVWGLQWPGGDLSLQLVYDNTSIDLDLFLYRPSSLDDSSDFSIMNSGIENVDVSAAVAGTYYVVIDSENSGTAGAYTLSVTPEPGTLILMGLGVALVVRRR